MLVSDARLGLENLPQPGWRKVDYGVAKWYAKELQVVVTPTIVNSQMLFDELKAKVKDLNLIQTTTLSIQDFVVTKTFVKAKK